MFKGKLFAFLKENYPFILGLILMLCVGLAMGYLLSGGSRHKSKTYQKGHYGMKKSASSTPATTTDVTASTSISVQLDK